MKRRCLKQGGREKAFWGALIPAIVGLAGTVYGTYANKKAQEEAMEEQKRAQLQAARRQQMQNAASSINNYFNTTAQEPEREFVYKNGGKRKLCYAGAKLTDGGPLVSSTGELIYPGQVVPPGTYRDLGPSHKQTNAQGKTGTGFRTSTGKPFETQGGETLVVDPKEIMVFSKDLKKNGISYADRAANGENPYALTTEQSKQRRHLRHGKSTPVERKKAFNGAIFTTADKVSFGANILGSLLSNMYATSAYNDLLDNVNYEIPGYVPELFVSGPTKVDDSAKRGAVKRADINARNDIFRNTASGNVGLGRGQEITTNSMYELMKIAEDTSNTNMGYRREDAKLRQEHNAREAVARNAYNKYVSELQKEQRNAKLGINQAKINSNVGMIQSFGDSFGNLVQQGIDNYQADQSMRAMLSASPYGTAEKMYMLGFDFNKGLRNDLAELSKYRMSQYGEDTPEYQQAFRSYDLWTNGYISNKNKRFSLRTAPRNSYITRDIYGNALTV